MPATPHSAAAYSAAPHNAAPARALRRAVFAVSVLADLDVVPANLGLTLPGRRPIWVTWGEVRRALAGHPASSELGLRRLTDWLTARRWAGDLAPEELCSRLRVVGLPTGHALHPGADWVRSRVRGGIVELGYGAVGLDPARPDAVLLLPTPALDRIGLDGEAAGLQAFAQLEVWGAVAAARAVRHPLGLLRPSGDADVVTLLGSAVFRSAMASGPAHGLATAVVPTRRRGWSVLRLIDPAFAPCAAAATPAAERGFHRPLLITADDVTMVVPGSRTTAGAPGAGALGAGALGSGALDADLRHHGQP